MRGLTFDSSPARSGGANAAADVTRLGVHRYHSADRESGSRVDGGMSYQALRMLGSVATFATCSMARSWMAFRSELVGGVHDARDTHIPSTELTGRRYVKGLTRSASTFPTASHTSKYTWASTQPSAPGSTRS